MGVPGQPLREGITEISPVISAPVLLAGAVHEGISPLPLVTSPILGLELVHAKVALAGVLIKLGIVIRSPGQTPMFVIGLTAGVGLMVTVKVIGVPVQPLRVGVTVIDPTIFTPVVFAGAVHEEIFPLPLVKSPIAAFELAHANVEPAGLLAKLPIVIVEPGQTIILLIEVTVGVG